MLSGVFGKGMKRNNLWLIFGLLLSAVPLYADAGNQKQTITLAEPSQIADASALQSAIDRVSERVMECVDKQLAPPDQCFCRYPTELSNFKKKYELAIQRNPNWQNASVHWSTEGVGFNLVFSALRRQVEMKCD